MPVYADVLVVINGFVNYLLLLCSMKILKLNSSRIRLLLGATIGSVFSLKIFLPINSKATELILRLLFLCIIIICAYKFNSFKEFIRAFVCFFIVSFIFSGLMIAIILFINPPDLIYDNGIIYYNINFLSVVILSFIGFIFVSLTEKLLKKKFHTGLIFETTVEHNNVSVVGRGLADSGNTLKEPFSGEDVIVADYNYIKKLSPKSINQYIETESIDYADHTFRLIPVSTVNGNGMLPAFRADRVTVRCAKSKKHKSNTYIAVSKEKLCNGEFEFILNSSFAEVN